MKTDGQTDGAACEAPGMGPSPVPLPPGPDRPVEEQTAEWFARPYGFMEDCARLYGEAFTFELGGTGTHVMFSHPDAVRQIFTAPPGSLQAGKGNAVWLSFMGPGSLLLLDGERHLRERRMLAPAFRPGRLAALPPVVARLAREAADRFPRGRPFSLLPLMLDLSLDVILHAVLGGEEGERRGAIRRSARSLLEASAFGIAATRPAEADDLGDRHPWEAFRRKVADLDRLLHEEIAERRTLPPRGDLLAHLLEAGLSDSEVRDEVVTLLMAGHETTATSLAWAFHRVLRSPAARERLAEELGPDPTARLPYLEAACQETLRLQPIIPMVSRRVAAPLEVGGYPLPAGVNVSAAVYLTHRRPDLYPDPEAFRPERFLERRFSPYEYYPFGGGERRCVGAEFALQEMRVALAAILSRVRLEPASREVVRPVRRNVSMAPADGARVICLE